MKIIKEDISKTTNAALVYHKTKSIDTIKQINDNGFIPGIGALFGKGFYSFYKKDVAENNKFYGDIILKCIVVNLRGNFLIFDKKEAKKIYGENCQLHEQIPNLPKECIEYLISLKEDFNKYDLFISFSEFKNIFKNVIGKELAGIILPEPYILTLYKCKKSDGFLYITGYKKEGDKEFTKIRYNQEFK
jgi:hypothetical protein